MNPYVFTVTCDVCGGEGAATPRTAAYAWDAYSTISHADPRVCRDVLNSKRRELEKAALAAADQAATAADAVAKLPSIL